MTPKLLYQLGAVGLFVAAIAFFVSDKIALGATFLALGAAFLAISNSKTKNGGGV